MAEASENSAGRPPQSVSKPTMKTLLDGLKKLVYWEKIVQLMMELGIEHYKLEEIEVNYEDIETQRRKAVDRLLRQKPSTTWSNITDALRKVGEVALAEELKKKHPEWKEPRAESMRTFIQTDYKDQPVKVEPVNREFCELHLKKPAISNRHFTTVPAQKLSSRVKRPVKVLPWIKDNIKDHLTEFLTFIEKSEDKDDFRVGFEARFGRQYLVLQQGSENHPGASLKEFKPDLKKHNKKNFHLQIYHNIQPVVGKYCEAERARKMTVIDPFKFVMEGQEEGRYIAVIEEVKHGVFLLKAVYRQPRDQKNSAKYDIVLPGREYDIRIADNCGPLIPVTRNSLSYRLAEDITSGMKRKQPDKSQLSFTPRGETSEGESKYFVSYFRQKEQTQYPWKGNKRWVLAKYEVDTFKDVYDMDAAAKKFPEFKEYDHNFDQKQHKQELELWNEKVFPKDADKTRPTRDEYLHMQSCKTPLFLPGEGEPVPPRPWTTEDLMRDFGEFLQAALDVADTLEKSHQFKPREDYTQL